MSATRLSTRFASPTERTTRSILGPPVVWVGVPPSSTTPGIAHKVSQAILVLLAEHGAEDVVVEWREAVLSMFSGPPLMEVVRRGNPTSHVRHIFTPALNIPIVTKERENEDSQGSVTLFFHENKDKHGDPSDKVLAVSNSHVLRKNTMADYSFKGAGADKEEQLQENRDLLRKEHKAIPELEEFYAEVKRDWSDIGDRDIGHVRFTKAITVDVAGGTRYTEDWGAFEVDEAKFRPQFEGTFVDLGTALTRDAVTAMFYPRSDTRTAFKYPPERKLRIRGVVPRELLAKPDLVDNENRPCLIVGKDGTGTGLTFGRYVGLESFVCNDLGVESMELGVYSRSKHSPIFSYKGDSGALIWDGNGRAVGQLHSGQSKDGLDSMHVTYATPAWWLLERIKLEFPHAVFFHDTWSL
ncbi:hypothetical protein EVG20_g6885 [Dentipellis fragilis]|uniref:Uncharacterized protein n=1 Tax=Dentipellis fragilis TaxID=205917 RepID=A0A4Y9YH64_9AGAM|nr:hypothetical protein EVG20_g6885 [Dentipellis fragilis]